MAVKIGSARHDENGKYSGGKKGDQEQKTTDDYTGEVSMQDFYVHSKGWKVIRPKSESVADKIASEMKAACNNKNIGYSQSDRYGIVNAAKKVDSLADIKTAVNADCSSTVRSVVMKASGKDAGDFTTANAVTVLEKTGLFESAFDYTSGTAIYNGDILVTKTKGHIVAVVSGNARKSESKTKTVKTSSSSKKVTVQATSLNVRTGAGTEYKIVDVVTKGTKLTITDTKDGWGKCSKGWINLKYAK